MIVSLALNAKTIVNYYMSYVLVLSLELTFKSSNKSDMRFMLQLLIRENEKENALILLNNYKVLIYL